jgi:hypothetical protein
MLQVVSSIISAITVIHYDRHYATKVVVMDLDEYTVEQKTKYVEGKLKLEDVKANFAAVKQKIDSYLKNHVLLFNKSVIAGGDMIRLSTPEEEKKKDGEYQVE